MFKDFLGNELKVGDRVIYIGRTRRYHISSILKFTSQYAVIEYPSYPDTMRQECHQLIKCESKLAKGEITQCES